MEIEEFAASISGTQKARKKAVDKSKWKRNQEKSQRYSMKRPSKMPSCSHSGSIFKCRSLQGNDALCFVKSFYKSKKKADQHQFIVAHTRIEPPLRTDRKKPGARTAARSFATNHFARKANGSLIKEHSGFSLAMTKYESKKLLLPLHTFKMENLAYYRQSSKYTSLQKLNGGEEKTMHGAKRVAAFCIMTALIPSTLIILPLYLRHTVFADVRYKIAESDIIEIQKGISSIFCEKHTMVMNSSFNAFQLNHHPEISKNRKHIRLKKSMSLPDDTMEYWGFYLLKGATVEMKTCSEQDEGYLLVIEGDRHLKTCGMDQRKNSTIYAPDGKVKVSYSVISPDAELIDSDYTIHEKSPEKGSQEADPAYHNNVINDDESRHDMGGEITDPPYEYKTEDDGNKKRLNETNKNAIMDKRHQNKLYQSRRRRDLVLDRKINHGGTGNRNGTNDSDSHSDVSSFENELLECYDGRIIMKPIKLKAVDKCSELKYLVNGGLYLKTTHTIDKDGYYYYIFYTDIDTDSNKIQAVFDIYKPTYIYANIPESKGCLNSTMCTFPINFWSDETVIVEVPTRDGLESQDEDYTEMISQCHPRMAVYIIFPVAVLFLILSCAFL